MKLLIYFGLLLCSGLLVIVACTAPGVAPAQPTQESGQAPPIPTITPTPGPPRYLIDNVGTEQAIAYSLTLASPTYTAEERRRGCKHLLPFDGTKAFRRYPADQPILWTFTVNFELLSKADGNPLGCLHLYRRNEKQETFDLIKQGNILVDTCEVMDETQSDGNSQTVNQEVRFTSNYAAIFDGTIYIQCHMNLSEWTIKISEMLGDENRVLKQELVTFTNLPTHSYDNFTIAASIQPTKTTTETLFPLVYYSPIDGSTVQPALVLRRDETDSSRLSVETHEECNLEGNSVVDPAWWYEDQLWWYDLRGKPVDSEPHLLYALNFLREPVDYNSYERSCRIENREPLEFSIGEATLYIGYDPNNDAKFKGTINGILIDPTDSKPEKS